MISDLVVHLLIVLVSKPMLGFALIVAVVFAWEPIQKGLYGTQGQRTTAQEKRYKVGKNIGDVIALLLGVWALVGILSWLITGDTQDG